MRFPILAAVFALSVQPALADGAIYVPLPTIPDLPQGELEHLLMQLVVANVVAANCPEFVDTGVERSLLIGSADIIAGRLGLDPTTYDARFYHPAFDYLDKPGTCEDEVPNLQPLLNRLIAWGGSLTPIE